MRHQSEAREHNILLVRNAAAYDFGGAERLVVHLAEELTQRHGYKTLVVSSHAKVLAYAAQQQIPHKKGWWWHRQNWSGKQALLFPIYLGWQVLLIAWYMQLIVRTHATTVHLMSRDDFIAGTLAARLLGKRVVWTDCADLKHIYANHALWYKNPVGKLVFMASSLAHHVMLVSFSEQRHIEASLHHALPAHYQVIHLAGRAEHVTPVVRDLQDKQAVIFCATSRLVVAKGMLELIDAFQELSRDDTLYRLWLVGDGPDAALCKKRARNNQNIVFWGHQDKPLPYLAASDVYVHPTHHEAFSLSIAEAAMLGKPIIATNVGGNPELVNDQNGILFPVGDTAALLAAMRHLATDANLRARLGKQTRHDYLANIDFSTIVRDRILPLYEA